MLCIARADQTHINRTMTPIVGRMTLARAYLHYMKYYLANGYVTTFYDFYYNYRTEQNNILKAMRILFQMKIGNTDKVKSYMDQISLSTI